MKISTGMVFEEKLSMDNNTFSECINKDNLIVKIINKLLS
jgi:hypothetical protein